MLRALLVGARAAGQRWQLVIGCWLVTALFGVAFALASGVWLRAALDGSAVTRSLLHTIDADVLVDLWAHHREGLVMLLVVAVILAAGHTAVWWWVHGVVIASLQRPRREWTETWMEGVALAPAMARLWALAMAALGLFSAGVGAGTYALLHWTRNDPAPLRWAQIGAGGIAVWLLGVVFLVAVHDHARIRACRARAPAWSAYGWALRFVLRGGERAFLVATALQLSALGVWTAYQMTGMTAPVTEVLGLTGSLLWAQAYLLARSWVRVWFFASENELQA